MVDAGLYRAGADKLPPEFLPLLFATWPGATIPGLPPEELQRNSVGASGLAALAEGYQMFRLVRDVCERYGRHTSQDAVILDYGCGWGRIIRFFLTVYDNRNVYGVDVDPDMVEYCQSLIGTGRYAPTSGRPPLDFEDGSIDVLYAYSVFSHLAPGLQDALVAEFYRIVRPGGFVFLTTRMRSFIDECVALRNLSGLDAYTAALAAAFPDPEKAKRQYDAGEFLFRPYPAGIDRLGSDYGEAIVPRGYGEQHWSRHFHLLDFIDDRAQLRQACFVLERRGDSPRATADTNKSERSHAEPSTNGHEAVLLSSQPRYGTHRQEDKDTSDVNANLRIFRIVSIIWGTVRMCSKRLRG